jgi:hypothetical protein
MVQLLTCKVHELEPKFPFPLRQHAPTCTNMQQLLWKYNSTPVTRIIAMTVKSCGMGVRKNGLVSYTDMFQPKHAKNKVNVPSET